MAFFERFRKALQLFSAKQLFLWRGTGCGVGKNGEGISSSPHIYCQLTSQLSENYGASASASFLITFVDTMFRFFFASYLAMCLVSLMSMIVHCITLFMILLCSRNTMIPSTTLSVTLRYLRVLWL